MEITRVVFQNIFYINENDYENTEDLGLFGYTQNAKIYNLIVNGNIKYVVTPSAKYLAVGIDDLKRSYKVSDRNIFLATIKKKN